MSRQATFFAERAGDARLASQRTGVPASVILAQWAVETGYGTSAAFRDGWNYAGVSPGGRIARYSSQAEGLAAYISTLLHPRYAPVRTAGAADSAARQLGRSPWAESRYGGDGRQLLQVMGSNNLAAFDDPKFTPAIFPILPFLPPVLDKGREMLGDKAKDLAGDALGGLVDITGIRETVLVGVGVLGASVLVVAGMWRLAQPAVSGAVDKVTSVAAPVAGAVNPAAGVALSAAGGAK